MAERKKLFEVRGLTTRFHTEAGTATAVSNVDFDIFEGEVLGIVGESGSGKSVTALSLTRLIPNPPGEITSGSVLFQGRDLLKLSYDQLHDIRGKEVAMIFQEPMTSLNPVFTVGYQIEEIIDLHENMSKDETAEHRGRRDMRLSCPAAPLGVNHETPNGWPGGRGWRDVRGPAAWR